VLHLKEKFARLRRSSLLRNSGWAFVGLGGNFALQAGSFLLMARMLGVTEYGLFAGAFALVSSVTPYSSLGSQMIFMRHVSLDRTLARAYWGNTLFITAITSICLVFGLSLAGSKLFGSGTIGLIIVLVVANCFMSQVSANASSVFQTFEQMRAMAWLRGLTNLLRLLALAGLALAEHRATPFQCALCLLLSSGIAAAIAVVCVQRSIGAAGFSMDLVRRRFWEGIGFSFAGSTQAVYNDVDKMMLSHYGMNAANGIYSMAYRVVDLATAPVTAIDTACTPRYFSLSKDGLPAVLRVARKIVPIAALSGLVAAAATLIASPLIVRIVGQDFATSLLAFRWLCCLPGLRGVHQLSGAVLTATGRQNARTAAQLAVALLNFGLNLMWIPSHGWLGAAWASLASDGALMILNLSLVYIFAIRATGAKPPSLQAESVL
jgi:O-antigen/teichoic acid export membrane protein